MQNVVIRLDEPPFVPLKGHGKLISEVVVRPPTFDEYLEYGDPFLWAPSPAGKVPYILPDNGAIAAYTRCMVIEPKDPLILAQGGFELAKKIRSVIFSFFGLVAAAAEGTETSPTS